LKDSEIDFYGNPDVQFHMNSGRNFESKRIVENEYGEKVEKEFIDTTPCPTIDVYENETELNVIVHIPHSQPIVFDWFVVEDDYSKFFNNFVRSLDEGYKGIDEITEFKVPNIESEIGEIIRQAIISETPKSVQINNITITS